MPGPLSGSVHDLVIGHICALDLPAVKIQSTNQLANNKRADYSLHLYI